MNTLQKIFVMVGLGSLVVFLITIFALQFSPTYTWFDDSHVDVSRARYQIKTGIVLPDDDKYYNEYYNYYNSYYTLAKEGPSDGDMKNKTLVSNFKEWQDKKKKREGVTKREWVFSKMFKKYMGLDANNKAIRETNWLGITALFNITFCSIGFFLFKDK